MKYKYIFFLSILAVATAVGFQNCAKAGFKDPEALAGTLAAEFCEHAATAPCDDEKGTGLKCLRAIKDIPPNACLYETCKSGFRMDEFRQCVPQSCTPGSNASCELPNGEGRMVCKESGVGYGSCSAIECRAGFKLAEGACVPELSCSPGTHRDCSTEDTVGAQTCNESGTGYGACVFGECQPGYAKEGERCVRQICEPSSISGCTVGAGSGSQMCNSAGTAWGSCTLADCQEGYTLLGGVCVIQNCSPNSTASCEFDHGIGMKTCSADGMNYGACSPLSCDPGFQLVSGRCVEQVCSPGATVSCRLNGGCGVGERTCNSNGMGYGRCKAKTCDEGFENFFGRCISDNYCEGDEMWLCTGSNGTGLRHCNAAKNQMGPCELFKCDAGFKKKIVRGKVYCEIIPQTPL